MGKTTIEWTSTPRADGTLAPGYTFNPWHGCVKVSPACLNCYAAAQDHRYHASNIIDPPHWGKDARRKGLSAQYWLQPRKWNREATEAGERRRVFCGSMCDIFEELTEGHQSYDYVERCREDVFQMAYDLHHLDWLFLTKRPENIKPILSRTCHKRYPHTDWWTLINRNPRYNWWFGTTVEDDRRMDERYGHLIEVPAVVRFLSCEPLLAPIDLDLTYPCPSCDGVGGGTNFTSVSLDDGAWDCDRCGGTGKIPFGFIHWIICGGESGSHARPSHPDWYRSLRDQCQAAGVPFFFKQHGRLLAESQWASFDPDPAVQDCARNAYDLSERTIRSIRAHGERFFPMPKHDAGRLLDGQEWSEFPSAYSAPSVAQKCEVAP